MDEHKQGDIPAAPPAAPVETPAPSQTPDPVAVEVQKLEAKPKRSRLETLTYNRDRLDQEIAEEKAKNGITEDDNQPLTLATYKELRNKEAIDTAFTLADSITDENERKLTLHHLTNTIRPSGDPAADLATARAIVNAVKTGQLLEETQRARPARTVHSAPSAPPKPVQNDELTPDEKKMTGPPFNLSKEQILAARPKQ